MEPEILTFRSFKDIEHYVIPSFQRRLDHNVSREIYYHIRDQRYDNKYPYLGCIDVVKFENNFYIIDGQHRFHAYKLDYELSENSQTFITVILYTVNSYKEMIKIFELRNMGVNVPKYILNCYNDQERELMTSIERWIEGIDGFQNRAARRPNVDITEFMNEILKYDILYEKHISTLKEFRDFFESQNSRIADSCKSSNFLRVNKITDTMLKKAESFNLYISLPQKILWFDF